MLWLRASVKGNSPLQGFPLLVPFWCHQGTFWLCPAIPLWQVWEGAPALTAPLVPLSAHQDLPLFVLFLSQQRGIWESSEASAVPVVAAAVFPDWVALGVASWCGCLLNG